VSVPDNVRVNRRVEAPARVLARPEGNNPAIGALVATPTWPLRALLSQARVALCVVAALTVVWIVLAAKMAELVWLNGVPVADSGVFATIGKAIVHGALPYRDFWDHKPPGIYYIDAFIFGVLSIPPWDFHLIEVPIALAGAAGFYWLARTFAGRAAAAVGTVVFAFFACTPNLSEGSNLTETYLILPIVLAYGLTFRLIRARTSAIQEARAPFAAGRPALALIGFFCAVAVLLKPQTVGDLLLIEVLLAIGLWTRGKRPSMRRPARLAVDLAIPACTAFALCGLVVLYFLARGAGAEMWQQVVVYNQFYASATSIAQAAHNLLGPNPVYLLWGIDSVAALVVGVGLFSRRRLSTFADSRLVSAGLLAWWLLSVVEVSADRQFWAHDFLFSVASSAALITYALTRRSRTDDASWALRLSWDALVVTAAGLLLVVVIASAYETAWFGRLQLGSGRGDAWSLTNTSSTPQRYGLLSIGGLSLSVVGGPANDEQLVAQKIVTLTRPRDAVFVWGAPTAVYLLSGRRAAARFLYFMPVAQVFGNSVDASFDAKPLRHELLVDLSRSKPRVVVVQTTEAMTLQAIPALRDWLAQNYHYIFRLKPGISLHGSDFDFYVRNS
jgi:hypothetical protein